MSDVSVISDKLSSDNIIKTPPSKDDSWETEDESTLEATPSQESPQKSP